MIKNLSLNDIYQFLLISLAFLMPLTVYGSNVIIVIICIIWLLSGNYKFKFDQIINNKLMLASILFFCLHLLGLLWTNDLQWGLHIVHKMWYFIGLFPILYTIVRKNFNRLYIASFLIAILISEICSYLIWFEIIEPFWHATVMNPTPFMSHVSYNPILAVAIYIVLHEIFLNKKIKNFIFCIYIIFAITMIFNMFITGGRAGQVCFFIMLSILIFQYFDKQRIKSIIITLILIPSIFMTAYQLSSIFNDRVNLVASEILNFSETDGHDAVGLRIAFNLNSLAIIKDNLIFGVGTGDFPEEYLKINKINTPSLPETSNPHSMYTLILVQLGLIGLLSMLSIFYYQIKFSYFSKNRLMKDFGLALPVMFLVLMISDSYLLGHFTSLIFIFFSSFLYKDIEKY
jgi:O-antigen ligase